MFPSEEGALARVFSYILFALWLLATSMVLLTPRDTVQSTGAAVKRQPAIQAHKGSTVYNSVDDGDNWHLFWFFGLAGLTWVMPFKPTRKTAMALLALLNLYSLATELVQEIVIPGRKFEWGDLLLNAIGIGAGCCVGYGVIWARSRQRGRSFRRAS